MTGLVIDAQACRGCGRCVRTCAAGALRMEGRLAQATEACVLCGMCVDACPFGAIEIVREPAANADGTGDCSDVWVFAQMQGAGVLPVAFELVGAARTLADALGCEVVAVLGGCEAEAEGATQDAGTQPGAGAGAAGTLQEGRPGRAVLEGQAALLVQAGADRVLLACDRRLQEGASESYAAWLVDLVAQRKPEVFLFGATVFGRELAPCVAAQVRCGLTADCTELAIDPETRLLHQTRPTFGGNLMATIMCPDARPQMATVRPGVLPAPLPDPMRSGEVEPVQVPAGATSRVEVLERIPAQDDDSVTDAETLVIVGRGIGAKKNLALAQRLADLLGAKLGCTRPLVEQGWLEYSHQVGQTGVSVSPKLLVSVGVSGAIQHLAGIGGAECVVAVNSDPEAPIFGRATYSVVGDCVEVLKQLVARLEGR